MIAGRHLLAKRSRELDSVQVWVSFFLVEQVAVKKEMINKNKSFDQNDNDDYLDKYEKNENYVWDAFEESVLDEASREDFKVKVVQNCWYNYIN